MFSPCRQGAGTAIGELPPYFMARAARLSGADPDDEDYEEFEEMLEQAQSAQVWISSRHILEPCVQNVSPWLDVSAVIPTDSSRFLWLSSDVYSNRLCSGGHDLTRMWHWCPPMMQQILYPVGGRCPVPMSPRYCGSLMQVTWFLGRALLLLPVKPLNSGWLRGELLFNHSLSVSKWTPHGLGFT